jgi:hypothetical protein
MPITTHCSVGINHSDRAAQINSINSINPSDPEMDQQDSSDLSDSNTKRQDTVLKNCEEFLLKSKGNQEDYSKKSQMQR